MKRIKLDEAYKWRAMYQPSGIMGGGIDTSRLGVLRLLVVAVLVAILGRLFFLQMIRGNELLAASVSNKTFVRRLLAPRGVIKDRKGEVLVLNEPVYEVLLDDQGRVMRDPDEIPREIALKMLTEGDLVGERSTGRYYPQGELLAHVLGYVGEVTPSDLENVELMAGDIVGKAGVEKTYDEVLRGQAGEETIELDAKGKVLRWVGETKPIEGADLGLTIDLGLQRKLVEAMDGQKGAVVASDPMTGEVLGLVSLPSFDPNVFSRVSVEAGASGARQEILNDEEMPMLNRVVGGSYPPGSVFKVVPATAGLELGEIDAERVVEDTGELRVDEYRYGNWYYDQYGRVEGEVDLKLALSRSNDIYFYKLGEWVGPDRLANWAETFGMGRLTGIELTGEVKGLVPNTLWKEREKGESWFLGNTYHFAIGQGDLLTTPIQVHQMMGVVASQGRWCKPKLVEKINDERVVVVECEELGVEKENLELVREGLVAACEPRGTAYPFFEFDLSVYGDEYNGEGRDRVGCKTGTAQFFDPDDRTHAWFSVFAPAVNPEIMVTVLVEAGGEGSSVAAPVAKEVLEYWFGRD